MLWRKKLTFTDEELKAIDQHAHDGGIDLWKNAREKME